MLDISYTLPANSLHHDKGDDERIDEASLESVSREVARKDAKQMKQKNLRRMRSEREGNSKWR